MWSWRGSICATPRWDCSPAILSRSRRALLRRRSRWHRGPPAVLSECPRFLRHGGALLLELGGEQAEALRDPLDQLGYLDVVVLFDQEGDVRGIEATLG